MRIRRVLVTKLFGMFNHEINLNLDRRVTIIFGPNGIGKTIILTMIDGLFNSDYRVFKVPFDAMVVEFDDKSCIRVVQRREAEKQPVIAISCQKPDSEERSFPLLDTSSRLPEIESEEVEDERRRMISWLCQRIADLQYLGDNTWRHRDSEPISTMELLERLRGELPERTMRELMKLAASTPEWFLDLRKEFPRTRLIHTKRLSRLVPAESRRSYAREPEKIEIPTVRLYAEELAKNIAVKVAEYAALSQKLDSTFPNRVIKQESPSESEAKYKELRNELELLSQNRARLQDVGLIVGEDLKIPEAIEDDQRRNFLNGVLTVYVKDLHEKFRIFDELAKRIELFAKNINARLSFKRLRVTQGEGFAFETSNGHPLSAEDLSSGEQHELVLNYELLFKVEPNSLILIDEPELSLHIAWQQQFMRDLLEITDVGHFDVMVATHSPDIIHDHWDLAVDLGESAK
jgi:predicted ATP-binding protein involved in virulence